MFFALPFIFFIFFIIVIMYLSTASTPTYSLLQKVFVAKRFSNISTIYSYNNFYIIKADAKGENYIFGVKKTNSFFTFSEISKLYDYAQKNHIHSIVLVNYSPITPSDSIYKKIKEYGIDVWDIQKLLSLSEVNTPNSSNNSITNNHSILKTSDTSNDKCKIEKSSFNPIQDGTLSEGLFSKLFDKPTRL